METRKRKQIPGAHRTKSIHRNVEISSIATPPPSEKFLQSTIINLQSTIYSTCPHCAGNSFEELEGVLETGLCVECEHEKTAWLIQKYTADEEARKKKKFSLIEPERKRKHIRTNFLSK